MPILNEKETEMEAQKKSSRGVNTRQSEPSGQISGLPRGSTAEMAHPPGLWDGMCHTCPYMTPHRWMLSGGFGGFGNFLRVTQ